MMTRRVVNPHARFTIIPRPGYLFTNNIYCVRIKMSAAGTGCTDDCVRSNRSSSCCLLTTTNNNNYQFNYCCELWRRTTAGLPRWVRRPLTRSTDCGTTEPRRHRFHVRSDRPCVDTRPTTAVSTLCCVFASVRRAVTGVDSHRPSAVFPPLRIERKINIQKNVDSHAW